MINKTRLKNPKKCKKLEKEGRRGRGKIIEKKGEEGGQGETQKKRRRY